jgi:hypothetical protein
MKECDPMFHRIDGQVDPEQFENFMTSFAVLLQDVQDSEPFEPDDVIDYLTLKMKGCPLVEQQRKEL